MRASTLLAASVVGMVATGAMALPAHAEWVAPPTAAGSVTAWGTAAAATATTLTDLPSTPAADIAANNQATAVVTTDGQFKIWGPPTAVVVTSAPTGVTNAKSVSMVNGYGVLLRTDGSVTGWGANPYITETPAGLKAKAVSVGLGTGYAVSEAGKLVTWGAPPAYPPPPAVTELTDLVDVSASFQHVLALRANGTVVTWGAQGATEDAFNVVPDLGGRKATQISAGLTSSGVVLDDGSVKIWPSDSALIASTPADLAGKQVRSLDLNVNAAVTTTDDSVRLWGPTAAINNQQATLDGTPVTKIAVGQNHAVALTTTFRELSKPSISGTAAPDQRLTATPASFSLTPETSAGQWYRGNDPVEGATSTTLDLTTADIGSSFSYRTTATRDGQTLESQSTPVGPVQPTMVASTVKVSVSPASGVIGAARTATATVSSAGAPTGSVTFTVGSTTISKPLTSGRAAWALPALPVGSHRITAKYSGDAHTLPSTSATIVMPVTKATSKVSATAKATGKTKKVAKKVTLTIKVKASQAPTGKVTVKLKGKTKKTVKVTVNAKGVGTVVLKKVKRGKYTATLSYGGNAKVLASTGTARFRV